MCPDEKIGRFQNVNYENMCIKFQKRHKDKKFKGYFGEKLSEALSQQALGFNAATTSAIVKVAHQF